MTQVDQDKQQAQAKSNPLKGLLTIPLSLASGWILYSNLLIDHEAPLPYAIPAKRVMYPAKTAVYLNYYVDKEQSGRPLVLIHSINAAASAYEMRPLFQFYRTERPVYALDLPGFGYSDRPARAYTPQYFTESILDFVESRVGEPVDVVAHSLSCEFVARAALARPELFNSLTFISPSGFNKLNSGRASQRAGMNGKSDTFYKLFAFPLWARPFFDLLATRRGIKFFLQQSFVGPIPEGFVDYAYAAAHQPGAANAPLYFVSGKLFTPDARTELYARLHTPTLVIYDRDAFSSFDTLPQLLAHNRLWHEARIVPSLGMPHFEKLPETTAAMNDFWQRLA